MARPPRYNVDYFPHSANHNKVILYLRRLFGNEGYAIFYLLLEKIALADNHFLNLQDDTEIFYLASELLVDEVKLFGIIKNLLKLKFFDQQIWDDYNVLFSESFNDTFKDAYCRRTTELMTKSKLTNHLSTLGIQKLSLGYVLGDINLISNDNNPQSKLEQTKKENTKEDKKKKEKTEMQQVQILLKKFYNNRSWRTSIISNPSYRLKNESELLSRMLQFQNYLYCNGEWKKKESEFIKHFNNWLNKVRMTPIPKHVIKSNND
ncbi:uncharacterized protein DUF4373 [Dokdonia sp. Hel_I_63]|uniref:DUF4373 domain-containing protein n=1 Tax=Dokdonia sp. Hel_I_63 TaxID=1249996 RepID=UPI00119BE732|nr:DUF4373 domain-containing protein [Dokdonia sp. Hel_I_63]TVZ23753.1 uncharacterized protein DUF4373 [Dokdonia sp. Hel_I_63]